MAFVPDPAAVHDYMDRYRQYAFVLGGLPTSVYRETIEHALRRFSACAGNVTIYWPKVPRTHPDQKHRGWCHVLCTTLELRNDLKGILNGHKIRPRSQPCVTKRAKYAIEEFERITPIPSFLLNPVSLGGPSATAQNVPAPTTTTTTSNSIMPRVTPSSKAPEKAAEKVADETTRRRFHELPAEWIPSEDPESGLLSMFKHYERLDAQYTKNDARPRFHLWKDSEEQGFHSIQRPGPLPRDAKFAMEERVYMAAASLDGTEDFYLVPLAEVEQREAQGWKLWKCPKPSLDDDGKDKRPCNFPHDVITNNRPHEDFEFYFPPNIVDRLKRTAAPPNWKPGRPLEKGYDEDDNISTAKEFRPPSQWKQVVTGSSNGHFPKIHIPKGIGLGWGDYDLFTE